MVLIKKMLMITSELERLDETAQYEEILLQVEARQKIIEEIDCLDIEIKFLEESSPDLIEYSDLREKLYREQLGLIQEMNDKQTARIHKEYSTVKLKLEKLRTGKQLLSAYGQLEQTEGQESLFIDNKR